MSTASVAIPAVSAIIIQALQAWIAMARMNGMSSDEIEALIKTEYEKFQHNTPDKLPDA